MLIEVSSKRLSYKLAIKGKYTVIQGDSGNGKTNLCCTLVSKVIIQYALNARCPSSHLTLSQMALS